MKKLLNQFLEDNHFTTIELANRLGITRQALYNIINGKNIMSTETFYRLHSLMLKTCFKGYAKALELEYKEQLRKKYKNELKILGMGENEIK